jgi:hypothetical protein
MGLFKSLIRSAVHTAEHQVPHALQTGEHFAGAASHGISSATHAGEGTVLHDVGSSAARNIVNDGARGVSSTEARAAASTAEHNIVTSASHAEKSSGAKSWKNQLAKQSPAIITAATGAGVAGFTVYQTNRRIGQGIDAGNQLYHDMGQRMDDMAQEVFDLGRSLGSHMPNPSSIEDAAGRALNSAHNTVEGITGQLAGPASTALTIALVLGTVVITYEGYRYLR